MHGVGDRIDEALIGVGREVDGDGGAGRDGGGDLDVEHHLAVGARGGGGRVFAAVDRDGGDAGRGEAERLEVGGEIGRAITAAELDEPDGLACAAGVGGELIELGDLDGGEGWIGRGGARPHASSAAGDAKVGLGLGPVVETEHGFDVALELGGQVDAALAHAVQGAVDRLLVERDGKGLLHLRDGAAEVQDAVAGLRVAVGDGEAELRGEGAHQLDGGGVGSVLLPVGGAREPEAAEIGGGQRFFALDDDRDGDLAAWRGWFGGGRLDLRRLRGGGLFAAGQKESRLGGEARRGAFAGGPWGGLLCGSDHVACSCCRPHVAGWLRHHRRPICGWRA